MECVIRGFKGLQLFHCNGLQVNSSDQIKFRFTLYIFDLHYDDGKFRFVTQLVLF